MASIKIIQRKELKQDGTSPLAIRITKNRQTSYVYLDYSVLPDQWDKDAQRVKRNHPNHVRLNNYLLKRLSEANDKALEAESQREHVSSKAVRQKIKPTGGATFFAQAQIYLDTLKAGGKYNRYTADKPRVNHFRNFLKGDDIAFQDITIGLLDSFKSYVKGGLKLSERSAMNHLVVIRSIFSQAVNNQVTDPKYYPFGKGKIKIKFPDSKKVGLLTDEIIKLENADMPDEYENHCRNLWLFSFYFAGIRVSDILRLRWSDFQNLRLHYSMGKNNKGGSLKIPEKAAKILRLYEQLKQNDNDLIFPELKRLETLDDQFETQRAIAFATSRIDKCLRQNVAPKASINKRLTMHLARHSFAQNAVDVNPRVLQMLFRHSSLETTIGYMGHFIHKDADDALDNVLNFSENSATYKPQ